MYDNIIQPDIHIVLEELDTLIFVTSKCLAEHGVPRNKMIYMSFENRQLQGET